MRISMRFNQDEEKQFNEMKQATGLSTTALIKKRIFDNGGQYYSKNMLINLGKLSTSVNLAEQAIKDNNNALALEQIHIIHKGVVALWQSL